MLRKFKEKSALSLMASKDLSYMMITGCLLIGHDFPNFDGWHNCRDLHDNCGFHNILYVLQSRSWSGLSCSSLDPGCELSCLDDQRHRRSALMSIPFQRLQLVLLSLLSIAVSALNIFSLKVASVTLIIVKDHDRQWPRSSNTKHFSVRHWILSDNGHQFQFQASNNDIYLTLPPCALWHCVHWY